MGRILFWVGLAVILWAVIALGRRRRTSDVARERRREEKKTENTPQPMIECPVCGTHFPKDEAVLGNGVAYCSEKCRGEARKAAFEDILRRDKAK